MKLNKSKILLHIALGNSLPALSMSIGILLLFADPGPVSADRTDGRPGLLVLFDADNVRDGSPEPGFVTEVALAVDEYEVIPYRLKGDDFKRWGFERQRETLRTLTQTLDATYSIWVVFDTEDVTLFVCSLLPGRAFLRTVDVPNAADVEKELAVAARELLAEISLTIAPPLERAPEPEQPPVLFLYELMLSIRGTFGIVGQEGPSIEPGIAIGARWWFASRLYLEMAAALDFGPYEKTGDRTISGISAAPGVGLGYSKKWRAVSLGPLITFEESWTRIKMTAPAAASQTYDWWHFRIGAGIDLGIAIKNTTIALDGTIGLSPVQEKVRQASDNAIRLVTPLVDVRVGLSLRFSIG